MLPLSRRGFLKAGALTALAAQMPNVAPAAPETARTCDVLVYGSTPGGVAAAIEAARRGCKVILACPQMHPGGMAASGLCTTDAVRREIFGGLCAEFIANAREEYRRTIGENSPDWKLIQDGWFYAPSVAERVFDQMLQKEAAQLEFLRGHHLAGAAVQGSLVTQVTLHPPRGEPITVAAKTFIDCTYEGDLAAAAKVPYRVGREGKDEYGEPRAGIYYMNWKTGEQIVTPDTGEPSIAIQAFCGRCMFTSDPARLVPIEKPASYEQHLPDLLPLIGDLEAKRTELHSYGAALPGQKFNLNGSIDRLTSLNCPGVSWGWPEADRHLRARLAQFHVDHAASFIWFLQNEKGVPDKTRERWRLVGLDRDEFADSGHWPWQIYVRQGRRIEGRAMVTAHNFIKNPKTDRTPAVEQAIAIGEHSFDVHPCHDRRFAIEQWMEGVLWYPKKALGPAQPGQVPFGAMLPRKINNLLVPVALASTHLAMAVLRMEPLWMTTSQIAGAAAATAKEQGLDAANVDPVPLPRGLKIRTEPYAAA